MLAEAGFEQHCIGGCAWFENAVPTRELQDCSTWNCKRNICISLDLKILGGEGHKEEKKLYLGLFAADSCSGLVAGAMLR